LEMYKLLEAGVAWRKGLNNTHKERDFS